MIGLRLDREVVPGDDIAQLIIEAARLNGVEIFDRDIIVVSQKIVSKAEGRIVRLSDVVPSRRAIEIAERCGKDPRLVELVLREASEILKIDRCHIITLTRHGFVCANAGIDRSNAGGEDRVVLLPIDPDQSARRIRRRLKELLGVDVAVIIVDTFGRPFREGVVNVAIGFAGINPFKDYRGLRDRDGYVFRVTRVCIVDEIAAAAELVMGQGAESTPFAIVRGVEYEVCEDCSSRDIVMPREKWLFR